MSLVIVTAPTLEPLTLGEMCDHLRLEPDDDDAKVELLGGIVRRHAENVLGRALVTQTWKLMLDCFDDCIRLPLPPLQSVSDVKYLDTDGTEQTLATTVYRVLAAGSESEGRIELDYGQVWPSTYSVSEAVRITFVAGYGDPEDVPDEIKAAMLMHLAALYENREPTAGEWGTYNALMLPRKMWSFGA